MLSFGILTENIFPYFPGKVKKNYIERGNSIYGIDAKGNEYQITPSLIQAYKKKYGKENTIPLHVAGGIGIGSLGAIGSTAKLSSWLRGLDDIDDPYEVEKIAAPFQAAWLGAGAYFGHQIGKQKMYNDIVKKRLSGEF